MIATRIFAVLGAAFLVGSVAIGVLAPEGLPLGHFLYTVDPGLLDFFQTTVRARAPGWAWDWLVLPVMTRPAWLLPACLGIVCCGLCATLSSRQGAPRSRRKRS